MRLLSSGHFSEEEEDILRKAYAAWPPNIKALMATLGRQKCGILRKANKMGLTRDITLTESEKEYIRNHIKEKSVSKIMLYLKRNRLTVNRFIKAEGLVPLPFNQNKWTPTQSEIDVLMASGAISIKEIAERLGRSSPTILKMMRQLGVERPIKIKVVKEPKPKRIRVAKVVKPKLVKPVVAPSANVPRDLDPTNRIRAAMARAGLL